MANTDQSIDELGIPRITMRISPLERIPTTVDITLTNVGEAAEAHATGVAIQEVQDSVDGKNAETLYMDDTEETPENTIAATIQRMQEALDTLAAGDISYGEGSTVQAALTTIEQGISDLRTAHVATAIPMSATDTTKISEKISTMETGLGNAVKFTEQTLEDEQKAQARTNIGAIGEDAITNVIRYGAQTLTAEQQAQARQNLDAAPADAGRVYVVTISNVAGLPYNYNDADITADMVVVRSVLSKPSAQLCDWTVTAANGSLTIDKVGQNTGIGYSGTDITLYLERTWSETAQESLLKQAITAPPAGYYYTRGFSQSDEDSIFTNIVTTGSIRVHRSGSFISVRLLEFVPAVELTAGTTYTIATLPENCRIMLMMQGNFISSNGQYRGILAVQAGAGTVAITPTGSNIPAGTSLIVYMPIYNMARDHDDQDMTGYTLTTP